MSAGMHGLVMRIRNELPEIEHTLNRSIEGVQQLFRARISLRSPSFARQVCTDYTVCS